MDTSVLAFIIVAILIIGYYLYKNKNKPVPTGNGLVVNGTYITFGSPPPVLDWATIKAGVILNSVAPVQVYISYQVTSGTSYYLSNSFLFTMMGSGLNVFNYIQNLYSKQVISLPGSGTTYNLYSILSATDNSTTYKSQINFYFVGPSIAIPSQFQKLSPITFTPVSAVAVS